MKTILATIVSMILAVSFANAQAKTCADLIKAYDTQVKTAKLDAANSKKAADLRKVADDQNKAKKEADCVKSINSATALLAPAKK